MKFTLKFILSFLIITACGNHKSKTAESGTGEINDSIPSCIRIKIEAIKKEPRWNPPAQVDEYTYNGKTVFLFSADCCDQYNMLYDNNCNTICAPSGGITGKGDGKCSDFFKTAKFIKLIWKDPR